MHLVAPDAYGDSIPFEETGSGDALLVPFSDRPNWDGIEGRGETEARKEDCRR